MYHDTMKNNIPYPNHRRMPNVVVRGLYSIGFFIADFGPLLVNLFSAIYGTIRKLFAFFVGLLIEISTVVILIGTIAFSVIHSIELLRSAGAIGGLEYIGVAIFEVAFISGTATLTKSLMKHKKINWFSVAGFVAGIIFVEWSNITGMTQNWTGWIIGASAPIMLIIAEGILAFQYILDDQTSDVFRQPDQTVLDKYEIGQPDITGQPIDNQTLSDKQQSDIIGQSVNRTIADKQHQIEIDRRTDTDTDKAADIIKSVDGYSDTDNGLNEQNKMNVIGHVNSDSDLDADIDSDKIVSDGQNGQIENKKLGRTKLNTDKKKKNPDTDKSSGTKKNVLSFGQKKSDTDKVFHEAKQYALDYYKTHNNHFPIRKLADKFGIKKNQAEKIRKELDKELTEERVSESTIKSPVAP